MRLAAITLASAAAACSEPLVAPTTPSWQTDVMPLFAANCVRCHMYPHRGDGQTALRLDSFDDTLHPGGRVAKGASPTVGGIFRRTHDIALLPETRGQGAGKVATLLVIDLARQAGYRDIMLVAVNGAELVWRIQGFSIVGAGGYGPGTYRMRRAVD